MSQEDEVVLEGVDVSKMEEVPEEGFFSGIKKKAAGRNWTWTLRIMAFIGGGCVMGAGINGLFSLYINILLYIVSIYLIVLGFLLVAVLMTFPEVWKRFNIKWVPFLHTYRGRGLYLIFLGSLCCGVGGSTVLLSIILGIVAMVCGVAHILLACFFRSSLNPSDDFNAPRGPGPTPDELKDGFKGAAAQAAWDNKETIGQVAYENRDTLASAAAYQPPSY
eukprot:TRINITY_DN1298_c0_g1_i1.p1 TRINITY_DN1298_c0_g1~~TRINITY_DN1298_c0_g1_i1.p1  ORF type:complete len:220 (+),score=43.23 TRINITY_DN1298_c0_g1_i1:208-867(+)